VKHGTNYSYVGLGCRCDRCRAAHNEAARANGTNRRVGRRGEAKRRWDREKKVSCPTGCGNMMNRRSTLCVSCARAAAAARRHERSVRICQMWSEGMTLRAIADALGWTVNQLGSEMHRMRAAGYDLPLRPNRVRAAA
jgi:hypothetical protein